MNKTVQFIGVAILVVSMEIFLAGCSMQRQQKQETKRFADADIKYPFANNEAVYIENLDVEDATVVEQWSFDGTLQQSYELSEEASLLYVNDTELLYDYYDVNTDNLWIMQIPIRQTESEQKLLLDQEQKIMEITGDHCGYVDVGGEQWYPAFYANENYLVYLSEDALHVYDRKAQKELELSSDPLFAHSFTQSSATVLSNVCRDQIIFNTEPVGENEYGAPYGFSLYHLGEECVETIDERCYTTAAFLTDPWRDKVYYQIETDQSIWEYDCESGEKRELISHQAFQKCYQKQGLEWIPEEDNDSMFLEGDTLYIIKSKQETEKPQIFSYELKGKGILQYEEKLTKALQQCVCQGVDSGDFLYDYNYDHRIVILEGKLLYTLDWGAYYCIDLSTAESKKVTSQDAEKVYFALAGIWIEDDTEKDIEDVAGSKEQKTDVERAAQRQAEKKAQKAVAKLSVEEQLSQLSRKVMQYWNKTGDDGYYDDISYTVTDLDHNGVLELLISTRAQGSGRFTDTKVFRADTEGKAVRFDDGNIYDDIVDGIDTVYYDEDRDRYHYITYDSGGSVGCCEDALTLQDGEFQVENICGWYETVHHKSGKTKIIYYKMVNGEEQEIAKADYKLTQIINAYFADCKKQKVKITWILYPGDRKDLTKQDVRQKLTKAYHRFIGR